MASFQGALIYKSGDSTLQDFSSGVIINTWTTEAYDYGDWWSSGSPSRLTVPSGVSTVRVHFGCNIALITSSVQVNATLFKNGSAFLLNQYGQQTTNDRILCFTSPIIEVTAGDYFEVRLTMSDTSVTLASDYTYFGIESTTTPRRCLAGLSGDLTAQNFTATAAIPFDTESYDTDSIHDNVTNNTRLTVPSGVTRVRTTGIVTSSAITANDFDRAFIRKNGANFSGGPHLNFEHAATTSGISLAGPPVDVTSGDYFELWYQQEADTSITVASGATFLGLEVVDSANFFGALVKKAANQLTANYTAGAAVAWDTEVYDTGGWHDNVTNNSRLTVPTGISKVRLYGQMSAASPSINSGNSVLVYFRKNGAGIYPGIAQQRTEVSATPTLLVSASSPVLEVTAGDYFELFYLVETDPNITVDAANSWFAIESVSVDSELNATGTGTAAFIGQSVAGGTDRVFAATGTGTALFISTAIQPAVLNAQGGGQADFVGFADVPPPPPITGAGAVHGAIHSAFSHTWKTWWEENRAYEEEKARRYNALVESEKYMRLKRKLQMLENSREWATRTRELDRRIKDIARQIKDMEWDILR